jgi:hypothetical protein
MESSDLVLSQTPSTERLAWLTQRASNKGATHSAFDFTCDVALRDALFILFGDVGRSRVPIKSAWGFNEQANGRVPIGAGLATCVVEMPPLLDPPA